MVTRHGPVGRRSWHIDRLDAGAKTDYRSGLEARQASRPADPLTGAELRGCPCSEG